MLLRQFALAGLERAEQGIEFGLALQRAQVLGVRAGDIDRDVAGVRVGFFQADQVVVGGALDGCVGVLADVDAEDALVAGALDVGEQGVDAVVVETHAVDDALGLGQTEHARFGVARLRARRDGADLDAAEAPEGEPVNGVAVLVEAGGEADAVGEVESHDAYRAVRQGPTRAGDGAG